MLRLVAQGLLDKEIAAKAGRVVLAFGDVQVDATAVGIDAAAALEGVTRDARVGELAVHHHADLAPGGPHLATIETSKLGAMAKLGLETCAGVARQAPQSGLRAAR